MNTHLLNLSDNQAAVAAAVGAIMPIVLAVPIQTRWSPQLKTLFSLAAYGLAAVVTALAAGQLTGSTWWQSALVIFLTGATAHQTVWKPTGIGPAVEVATNKAPSEPSAGVTAQLAGYPPPDEPDDAPAVDDQVPMVDG